MQVDMSSRLLCSFEGGAQEQTHARDLIAREKKRDEPRYIHVFAP